MDIASADFTYFDQVHAQLPLQAVQPVMSRFLHSYPLEEDSDDVPPGLARGRLDGLDFESVLGTYDPAERRITVWTRGVVAVSEVIGLPAVLLRRVVRLHEAAHALHHRGYDKEALRSPNGIAADVAMHEIAFGNLKTEAVEQVAQLVTLAALRVQRDAATDEGARRDVQAMLDGFRTLMGRQSPAYRLPDMAFDTPVARLKGKIRLLLDLSDAGVSMTAANVDGLLL